MATYIEGLITGLIGKRRVIRLASLIGKDDAFVAHLKLDLLIHDVGDMCGETLGKVMHSIPKEEGDFANEPAMKEIVPGGDSMKLLRELVASILAIMIRNRVRKIRSGETAPISLESLRTKEAYGVK